MCLIAVRSSRGTRSRPGCEPSYAGYNVDYALLWEANSSVVRRSSRLRPYSH